MEPWPCPAAAQQAVNMSSKHHPCPFCLPSAKPYKEPEGEGPGLTPHRSALRACRRVEKVKDLGGKWRKPSTWASTSREAHTGPSNQSPPGVVLNFKIQIPWPLPHFRGSNLVGLWCVSRICFLKISALGDF